MTKQEISSKIEKETIKAVKKFCEATRHIDKIYMEKIADINTVFRKNKNGEVVELYDYLVKMYGSEECLYLEYKNSLDVESMVDSCGFYDTNENFKNFIFEKTNKQQATAEEITYKYKATYYDIYSRLETYSMTKSMIKMAYIHLHTAFDEFVLEIIYLSTIIEFLLKKGMSERVLNDVRKKQNENNTEHRLKYLRDKGFNFSYDNLDDIILFSQIRNALIHSNNVIILRVIDVLAKTTKYKSIYKVGDSFELNAENLESWKRKLTIFQKQLLNGIQAMMMVEREENENT